MPNNTEPGTARGTRIPVAPLVATAAVVAALVVFGLWSARESGGVAAADRAVLVSATGCGFAGSEEGSGVAVGGSLVVTAAHVVAQADAVEVTDRNGAREATVVVLDTRRDLAVLDVPGLEQVPAEFVRFEDGHEVEMVGGRQSGTQRGSIVEWVELTIEEVLGTDRHSRLGYEITIVAAPGDSGAGIFDGTRLGAILFATESDRGTAWATAASEVEAVLAAPRRALQCDPERSRLG